MEIVTSGTESVVSVPADAVAVGIFSEDVSGVAAAIDSATDGLLQRLTKLKELSGELGKSLTLYCPPGIAAPILTIVGLGPHESFGQGEAFRAGSIMGRGLSDRPRETVAIAVDPSWPDEIQSAMLAGVMVGSEDSGLYKTEGARSAPATIRWLSDNSTAAAHGQIIGDAINLTRRLVTEPPSKLNPVTFADRIANLANEHQRWEAEIWDERRLTEERCGALMAVAQGSVQPPRLAIMRYQAADPSAPWLALVGKGVTFDSGGLSLKPSSGMLTMKCDMAGAATVVGAMQAISGLELPINVMGLVGLVENMPSAHAYKLGDVLTTRNGKTIEVHNTDAEGRLVLADVLAVAVDLGADRIVDLATLTGACVVALGTDVAGLMTNHQAWCDVIIKAAHRCGERVWQLPMFSEFGDQIKGSVGDIKNVGEGRYGGAITAAKLLEHFVDGKPWTHIDIAGPAYMDKPKAWIDAGGTGVMVRTLIELAKMYPPEA